MLFQEKIKSSLKRILVHLVIKNKISQDTLDKMFKKFNLKSA